MRRPSLVLAALALAAAAPAAQAKGLADHDEGSDPRGITVSGFGLARVAPPARPSDERIRAAIEAARPLATSRAMNDARRRAAVLAAAAGLTLGDVVAVREDEFADEAVSGSFCRRSRRRPGRTHCRVPAFTFGTMDVRFATRETDAAPEPARTLTADGDASQPVGRPADPRSSTSIRRAIGAASNAALAPALEDARRAAAAIGRPAGASPGQVLSIVEPSGGEFGEAIGFAQIFGPFGVGEFCGTITRRVYRRDPETGRRRVVRRTRERVCFVPGEAYASVRATFAGG